MSIDYVNDHMVMRWRIRCRICRRDRAKGTQASREEAALELRLSGFWWTWRSRGIGLESLLKLAHGFFEQFVDGRAGALTEVIEDGHLLWRETAGRPLVARWFAIVVCHAFDSCVDVLILMTNTNGELSTVPGSQACSFAQP